MAVVKPYVFQIVGFQNSGKTTFIRKLIQQLSVEKFEVVSIKHHGHGGKPEVNEDKDSSQHIKAGAVASLVEGDGRLILHGEREKWSIGEQINILSILKPDIILVEGHKNENFPKAVIVRREEDVKLLSQLKEIKMVLSWDESLLKEYYLHKNVELCNINDPSTIKSLVEYLKKNMQ